MELVNRGAAYSHRVRAVKKRVIGSHNDACASRAQDRQRLINVVNARSG